MSNNTLDDVLGELNAGPPMAQDQTDNAIYARFVAIKAERRILADKEKTLKHESALLTKELEKRFTEADTQSIRKLIGRDTCTFALKRTPTVADPDPELTAKWFDKNAPGMTRVVNRTLVSFLRDYLQDDSLGEWVNDIDRLPEGLRHLKLDERVNLSLTIG